MKDDFEITKESFLSMQVCTNIPPERKQDLNTLVNRSTISGTTNGWVLEESIEPVRCAEKEDCWHYIFVC
jgi:hypothetical protein